jgi:hypothetical protein
MTLPSRTTLGSLAIAATALLVAVGSAWSRGSAAEAATPKPSPKRATANLWVDPTGGSCTRSATPRGYVDRVSCRSLQQAYRAAAAGDTVNIVDGRYGGQALGPGATKVTFRAAGPGRPSFGQFISAAANITVRGILIQDRANFDGPCTPPGAVLYPCGANQTYDNVIVDGLNAGDDHGIRGVGERFTLRNSEIRNVRDQKGFEGGSDGMLIEHNYWHDITLVTEGVHNECMYVDGGNRSTFRGNLFIGCPTMALFFTNWDGGAAYRNVTIENNVFGHTLDNDQNWHSSCSLYFGPGANNQNTLVGWSVRYNTFENAPCVADGMPTRDGIWIGNLGGITCMRGFTYRYNVGETCGGTGDFRVPNAVNSRARPNSAPFYVNAPAGDFHLRPGSAAINRGDPKTFPRRDRADRVRAAGSAPDAGAFEFRP